MHLSKSKCWYSNNCLHFKVCCSTTISSEQGYQRSATYSFTLGRNISGWKLGYHCSSALEKQCFKSGIAYLASSFKKVYDTNDTIHDSVGSAITDFTRSLQNGA